MSEHAPVPQDATVLSYHEYLSREGQDVYGTRHFCGACRRGISGIYGMSCYGFPEYPEDLEAKNERDFLSRFSARDRDKRLEYYSFCPWCGAKFSDEWWQDRTIQNERAIDHYENPGTHKGDKHEFRGEGPECMANHWLAVSGGSDKICWCDPEIEPGIMGCVIRHQDKRYEDVESVRQEMTEDDFYDDEDGDWEEEE